VNESGAVFLKILKNTTPGVQVGVVFFICRCCGVKCGSFKNTAPGVQVGVVFLSHFPRKKPQDMRL
jgi:hypothetical protein